MNIGAINIVQKYRKDDGTINPLFLVNQNNSVLDFSNWDDNLLIYILLLKLAKTPEGMKIVGKVLDNITGGTARALIAFCGAAHATDNHISQWGSARLLGLWMERMGMITKAQAVDFNMQLLWVSVADISEDVTKDISSTLGQMFSGISKLLGAL